MDELEKTDEELALLVQSGKVEFFGTIIKRYNAKMERYARKFLSDGEDIKDIVQSVFIKAYVSIKSFDVQRKFSSWLYRIAYNELVNALKKKKNKGVLPLFDLDVFFPHIYRRENTLQEDIDRSNSKLILEEYLDKLDQKYREPIVLYYFEELSYKEISDIMQIPVSTVGIRIKRGKILMQSISKNKKIYGQ